MDITLILLIIGLISIILSFFFGNSHGGHGDDIENISISLHHETNQLKKRLRAVEEELMIGVPAIGKIQPAKNKPVHEIIINQILSLHAQGYSIDEIAKRSSLSTEQVSEVLNTRGASV